MPDIAVTPQVKSPLAELFGRHTEAAYVSDITVLPQVKSPRAIELDKLVERMTEFYSEESNRNMYKLKKVSWWSGIPSLGHG